MTTLLVVTGDEHVNCSVGLCVRPVQADAGGTFYPSKTQRATAAAWKQFWQAAVVVADGAPIWWVNVGDALDLNKHDNLAPITQNRARIMDLAMETYGPLLDITERRFIVRGTEAHVGPHCELEELLGRELDAEVCPDDEARAWWQVRIECEGLLIEARHHLGYNGRLPWTKNSGASRTAALVSLEYRERGERVPDLLLGGHIHTYTDSGLVRRPRVFTVDGWQALTPHAYKLGYYIPSPVGGMWFLCDGGQYKEERWHREPKRAAIWRENSK